MPRSRWPPGPIQRLLDPKPNPQPAYSVPLKSRPSSGTLIGAEPSDAGTRFTKADLGWEEDRGSEIWEGKLEATRNLGIERRIRSTPSFLTSRPADRRGGFGILLWKNRRCSEKAIR